MDRSWMILVAVAMLAASPSIAADSTGMSHALTLTVMGEAGHLCQSPSETSDSGTDLSGPEGAFFVVFMLGMMLFYLGVFAAAMIAWVLSVLALWDCARRDFPDPNSRAGWCILIMLVHGIGALIYYIVIYRADDPPYQPRPWADARTRQSVLDGATAPRRRDAEEGTGNTDDAGADAEHE